MKKSSKKTKKQTNKKGLTIQEKALKDELGVYHLLVYVEDCASHIKKFSTVEEVNDFIFEFTQQYPESRESGSWIDYVVTDILGEVILVDESYYTTGELDEEDS